MKQYAVTVQRSETEARPGPEKRTRLRLEIDLAEGLIQWNRCYSQEKKMGELKTQRFINRVDCNWWNEIPINHKME